MSLPHVFCHPHSHGRSFLTSEFADSSNKVEVAFRAVPHAMARLDELALVVVRVSDDAEAADAARIALGQAGPRAVHLTGLPREGRAVR